jgi:hypothetical protein
MNHSEGADNWQALPAARLQLRLNRPPAAMLRTMAWASWPISLSMPRVESAKPQK